MKSNIFLAAICFVAALSRPALAADEHGHDHGAPATAGPALPRFAAVSEAFELVGVLNGKQLTVYLDRFKDNAPVKGASIELEISGAKVALTPREDGEYHAVLAEQLQPGTAPVTAMVVVGNESDLLAADLQLPAVLPANQAAASGWSRYGTWAIAATFVALVLAWGLRRWRSARRLRSGGAA